MSETKSISKNGWIPNLQTINESIKDIKESGLDGFFHPYKKGAECFSSDYKARKVKVTLTLIIEDIA